MHNRKALCYAPQGWAATCPGVCVVARLRLSVKTCATGFASKASRRAKPSAKRSKDVAAAETLGAAIAATLPSVHCNLADEALYGDKGDVSVFVGPIKAVFIEGTSHRRAVVVVCELPSCSRKRLLGCVLNPSAWKC